MGHVCGAQLNLARKSDMYTHYIHTYTYICICIYVDYIILVLSHLGNVLATLGQPLANFRVAKWFPGTGTSWDSFPSVSRLNPLGMTLGQPCEG